MSRSELRPVFTCIVTVSPGWAMALPGIVAVALPTWSFQSVRRIGSEGVFFRLIHGVASPMLASVIWTRAAGAPAGLGLATAAASGEAFARGEEAAAAVGARVGAAAGAAGGALPPHAMRNISELVTNPSVKTRRVDRCVGRAPCNAVGTPCSNR